MNTNVILCAFFPACIAVEETIQSGLAVGDIEGQKKYGHHTEKKNTDQICRQLGALILKNSLRSKRTNLERFASSLENLTITFSSRVQYSF
jgi:hypothetical protein